MANEIEGVPKRFLFCSLASYGFLNPLIGLAKELVQRGHQVTFVTDLAFAGDLEAAGLTRIGRSATGDGPSFTLPIWYQPLAVAIQSKHIEYAVQRFAPDVLVTCSLCLGPLIAADLYHLPVGILGLSPYLWPVERALLRRPARTEDEQRRTWRFHDMLRYLNSARQLYKLPPLGMDFTQTPLLGDLYMLRSCRWLEPLARSLPPRVHFVGSCLWEPAALDAELASWLADTAASGLPLLYVQHGSTFDLPRFWPVLVELLGGRPVRVAVSAGRMQGEFGEIPDNFFVRPHVPQALVLSKAQAAISSGNSTAVLGALEAGLPSLLIPGGGEQVDLAERCVRAGAAMSCPAQHVDRESFRGALDLVLTDARLRQGAVRLQKALQRLSGFRLAADLLTVLAGARRPVLRIRGRAGRPAPQEECVLHA